MTRVARHRTRVKPAIPGGTVQPTIWTNGVSTAAAAGNGIAISSFTETCDDFVGRPVTAGNLIISSRQASGGLKINGSVWSSFVYKETPKNGYEYQFVNYQFGTSVPTPTLMAVPIGWELATVARSNPSRPVVTPLTLAQDLYELPKMIFEAGKYLSNPSRYAKQYKTYANTFLGVKFGWIPLVEDINKLLNLQSEILRRQKQINELYSGRGLRRKITFGEENVSTMGSTSYALAGAANYIGMSYSIDEKRKTWATIRWQPVFNFPSYRHDVLTNELIRRVVSGATIEGTLKGAWDVIPWTWLLGWFTNVGDMLLAYSNTIPATHGAVCLMRSSEVKVTGGNPSYVGCIQPQLKVTGANIARAYKTRTASNTFTPGVGIPYMDISKLAIVGALFAQRLRPGRS